MWDFLALLFLLPLAAVAAAPFDLWANLPGRAALCLRHDQRRQRSLDWRAISLIPTDDRGERAGAAAAAGGISGDHPTDHPRRYYG